MSSHFTHFTFAPYINHKNQEQQQQQQQQQPPMRDPIRACRCSCMRLNDEQDEVLAGDYFFNNALDLPDYGTLGGGGYMY